MSVVAAGGTKMADMGAAVFLELLARDAAVVEYERPLVEARARRAPAEEIDELELAKRHALRVRAPLGSGLGGLVAQTATPYSTPNYPDDPQFQHTPEIDAAVRDEGLVAI